MEITNLRNGTSEVAALVKVTMLSLETLIGSNPIAFYELVMKCRDSKHVFFGGTVSVLQGLSLVRSDGSVHESIKNIVQSATVGDGLKMTLVSPFR